MKIHQKKNIRWNGIVRREKKMKSVIVYASVHHGNRENCRGMQKTGHSLRNAEGE